MSKKNPKRYSSHCNILTWKTNAPFLLPYTVIDKYAFISYPSKPTFERLGNIPHKPVWQHFSNSCGSEHPGKLSADLYAAQLDIWVCPATLPCHWIKNVRSPLFPSSLSFQPLRQWNFPLERDSVARGGERSVFVLLLLSTIIQSFAPPLRRIWGWLAVSLTEGEQCSGKLDNRIKIYGATGMP